MLLICRSSASWQNSLYTRRLILLLQECCLSGTCMIQSKGNYVKLSTQRMRPLSTTDWILNLGHRSLKPVDLWEFTLAEDLTHNTWSKVKWSVSPSALNRIYEHHHTTDCQACGISAEHNPKWGLTHPAWNFWFFRPVYSPFWGCPFFLFLFLCSLFR